jgi:hypothetical protein
MRARGDAVMTEIGKGSVVVVIVTVDGRVEVCIGIGAVTAIQVRHGDQRTRDTVLSTVT